MFIDSRTLLFLDSGTLLPVDSRTLLLIDSCTLLVIFGTTSLSSTISRLGRGSSNHRRGGGRCIVSSCGSSSSRGGRVVSTCRSSRSWSTVSRLPLFTSSLEEIEGENGAGHSLHEKARSQNNLKYQNWSIYIRPQNHSNSTL